MRRLTTRPDRAPVTGPAAWFIRFVGVDGVIGPLGFGGFTIPAIISVAQGRGIIYVWGTRPTAMALLSGSGYRPPCRCWLASSRPAWYSSSALAC